MRKVLLVVLFVFSPLISIGQRTPSADIGQRAQLRIRKQIMINELENQIKEVRVAAARVLTLYKLASWLWEKDKDDLGKAEALAVSAVEDLVKNRDEIPQVYRSPLLSGLLGLLERHAPETARKLRKKHDLDLADSSVSLLEPRGAEKRAVDEAITSIFSADRNDVRLIILLGELQERRSAEFVRLAEAIVAAEESTRIRLPVSSLILLSGYYVEQTLPRQLEKRFLTIAVNRSAEAGRMADGDVSGFFDLLGRNLPAISARFPELLSEATLANAVLSSRVSLETRESRARNERIDNSPDPLETLVAEADQAKLPSLKYELYMRAARLALKLRKYKRSVDLILHSAEVDMSSNSVSEEVRANERNRFLADMAAGCLDQQNEESADYAIKKLPDPILKAELLIKKSKYFIKAGDVVAANAELDQATKLAANIEDLSRRASVLLNMLTLAQKLDPARMYEINRSAAKSINALQVPNKKDEETDTENYKLYVTKIMVVNWNLLPTVSELSNVDLNGAADLANRIEKKEIKILADYIITVRTIENFRTEAKTNKAAVATR